MMQYKKVLKGALKENPLASYDRQLTRLNVYNSVWAALSLMSGIVMVEIHWATVRVIPASSRSAPDIYVPDNQSFASAASKFVNTFSCFMLQIGIYWWYQVQLTKLKLKGVCFKSEGLKEAGLLTAFLCESFLCIVHPVPGFEGIVTWHGSGEFKTMYSSNDLLIVLMMPRLYLVFRVFFDYFGYTGEDLDSLGRLTRVQTGTMFGVKALLKEAPFASLAAWNAFAILCLAYAMSIFERPTDLDFQGYRNCVWVIFVTFATVGYGDVYPTTDFGRVTAVIACLLAQLNLALLVLGVSNYFSMTETERKVLYILNRRSYDGQEKDLAAVVVQRFWRSCAGLSRTSEAPLIQSEQYEKDYKMAQAIREFRLYRRLAPKVDVSLNVLVMDTFLTVTDMREKIEDIQDIMNKQM